MVSLQVLPMVEDEKLNYGEPDSENLIVQGDNLEALKALLLFYAVPLMIQNLII